MATGEPTDTPTEVMIMSQTLTLAQWFSPAFPIGAFSYSHGLEQAIEAGAVVDAASLRNWASDALEHGSGRADALFLAAAFHAKDAAAVVQIDALCRAFAPSRERLFETQQQGDAFCRILSDVWGTPLNGLCYPVAAGRAARLCDLPLQETSAVFLHAFVANLSAVGQRLVPVGQTDGQTMIHALAPLCHDIAGQTASGDLSALTATAFLADIASMRHETQYSRIFRT